MSFKPDLIGKVLEVAETTRNDILGPDEPIAPAVLFEAIGGEKTIDAAYNVYLM
jgi:hypothetical protein